MRRILAALLCLLVVSAYASEIGGRRILFAGQSSLALNLQFAGSSTLDSRITFNRASNATQYDSTGKNTYAPNNLITWSNDFTNAAWTKVTLNVTTGVLDPIGGTNASTLTATGTGELYQSIGTLPGNGLNTIWIRRRTGSGSISLRTTNETDNFIVPTGSWVKYTSPPTPIGGYFHLVIFTSGDAIDVYQAQSEQVTYETTPRTYNATTASAFFGPRLDYDPATLAAKGLLIEEQRTNVVFPSNNFSSGWTTNAGVLITANSTTSPDGTTNATKLYKAAGAGTQVGVFATISSGAVTMTTFVYAKASSNSWVFIDPYDSVNHPSWFDLTNGVTGTNSAGNTSTIQNIGNGWYKCTVTRALSGSGSTYSPGVFLADSDNTTTFTGDGSKGAFIYGFQGEVGAFATSYIPTTSASATRAADSAVMTGTNFSSWYTAGQGTFVEQFQLNGHAGGASLGIMIDLTGITGPILYFNGGGAQSFNGTDVIATANSYTPNTAGKAAIAYDGVGRSVVLNGGAANSDLHPFGAGPATAIIISDGPITGGIDGTIKSLQYYNRRLSNAQLQALTQ